jgi:hypothetical protein
MWPVRRAGANGAEAGETRGGPNLKTGGVFAEEASATNVTPATP